MSWCPLAIVSDVGQRERSVSLELNPDAELDDSGVVCRSQGPAERLRIILAAQYAEVSLILAGSGSVMPRSRFQRICPRMIPVPPVRPSTPRMNGRKLS